MRFRPEGPEARPMRAASIGVTVSATHRENRVEKTTVIAKGLNICPIGPPARAIGMNTPRLVEVVDRTASAISLVPSSAASSLSWPSSLYLMMFSMTSMELFTSMPVEMARPSVVIRLRV